MFEKGLDIESGIPGAKGCEEYWTELDPSISANGNFDDGYCSVRPCYYWKIERQRLATTACKAENSLTHLGF
jgi:hypothetical protein